MPTLTSQAAFASEVPVIPVRIRPHKTVHRDTIVIGERVRGVVTESLPELVESIQQLGLLYPVLIDEGGILIDGEQRLAALAVLGIDDIPVIVDSEVTGAGDEHDILAERMRRELASNGVRTSYTPVQAAAARRRLRELLGKQGHTRTGVPLAERRKNWASELATSETGVSRTTMDRVDRIVRIAEDDAQPMTVRREAAEGLTRIDIGGVAVDRVLKDVELSANAASALTRYPALIGLPSPGAQVQMAQQLDLLPEETRAAQLEAMESLFSHSQGAVAAFQTLRDTSARIGEVFEMGDRAVDAVRTLAGNGTLTPDLAGTWASIASRFEDLAERIRTALSQEDRTS